MLRAHWPRLNWIQRKEELLRSRALMMFCNLSAWRRRGKLCYLCPAEETSITCVAVALLKGADGRWFYQCTQEERTPSRCNPPDHSLILKKKKKKQHTRWTYASSYNLELFVTEHLHECTHMAIAVIQCKYIHVNQWLRSILPFHPFFYHRLSCSLIPASLVGKVGNTQFVTGQLWFRFLSYSLRINNLGWTDQRSWWASW